MSELQPNKLPAYAALREPLLVFGNAGADAHPLRGLARYGPFTRSSFGTHTPKVRLSVSGPPSGRELRRSLLTNLRSVLLASDRKDFVPDYPSFENLFGVQIVPASPEAREPRSP